MFVFIVQPFVLFYRHFNLCTKHITSVYDLLKIEMILQCLLCTNITKSNDVNNVSNVFIAGF